ncbi:MAG: ABC transporter permease [Tistrella sp.]|jgi:putative ABC transport system permease protein|uniref:ABC transporter permease n=1 Tax=Tistrella mobilis TaxID=171437 RepID=A0A3B9IMR2_9PROT|nr:ABC transporter permease [Tistrella sp.]MAD39231.1 ABC transporter permease [Tistrella sp.]MBA76248.1 ABC transporter permease [Tistrella sp.]HAE49162.1 ABC transporter permease [Tistrella mobilis]
MSLIAWMGAIETGFVYALVALGVFLSFRILDFPDLTVDGSFPLGAAVSATAIVGGWDPFLSTALAFVAGCIAGSITAWLNVRLKILNLLASILMMIALYSINLRIMGRPNVALLGERTVLTPFEGLGLPFYLLTPLVFAVVVIAAMILLIRFLNSEMGLAMRATGANARMARAQGINTAAMTLLGMALSNGLVAIGGALFAQSQGSADVTMGVGTIVVGLASVIGGEAVMSTRTIARAIIACLVGAILYRVAVALALNAGFLGLTASDLNLVTAVLVAAAMVLPRVLAQRRRKAA